MNNFWSYVVKGMLPALYLVLVILFLVLTYFILFIAPGIVFLFALFVLICWVMGKLSDQTTRIIAFIGPSWWGQKKQSFDSSFYQQHKLFIGYFTNDEGKTFYNIDECTIGTTIFYDGKTGEKLTREEG